MQTILHGGGDSGLVRAVERHGAARVGDRLRIVAGPRHGDGAPAAAAPSASPAPPTASSERRDGVRELSDPTETSVMVSVISDPLPDYPEGYLTTAAASLDSGSASAFTASESSLRSALPTLS